MVKKNKKQIEIISSSEESNSDDFYQEELSAEAKRKKYSLRQRRSANFAEDFDYDILEEHDDSRATCDEIRRSDDEDFDLRAAQKEDRNISPQSCSKSTQKIISNFGRPNTVNCTITKSREREVEPEIPQDIQSSNDMIDFEDVIRADVLVNKNRIDYDSIIEKTEIKIEKRKPDVIETEVNENKKLRKNGEFAKKRGRKPRKVHTLDDNDFYTDLENKNQNFEGQSCHSAGLPINTVLGVTESLYELAERYHLQGGIMEEQLEPSPVEPILNERFSTEHANSIGGDDLLIQSESASCSREIF